MKKLLSSLAILLVFSTATAIVRADPSDAHHTGPPDIQFHIRDVPVYDPFFAICNGYNVVLTGVLNGDGRVWLAEDGSLLRELDTIRTVITLTNSVTDISVDIRLVFRVDVDYTVPTATMTGLRSVILKPKGGVEEIGNVGRVIILSNWIYEGEVISATGANFAAITDGMFSIYDEACVRVAS